jgi:glycosyltransferase involved in cell wall biosynthesis
MLVTCLCLTRNRREWLPQAIGCFAAQTYPDKELLIVADGEDVRDLACNAPVGVRLIEVQTGMKVGAKRNAGCEQATGSLIAHWDDDDHSAPSRLAHQVAMLRASEKAVAGYHSMRFTDGRAWWQQHGAHVTALGTSLCYQRAWWRSHPFEHRQIGQDEAFARAAWSDRQLVTADAGGQMYATVHEGNTSKRKLSGDGWESLPGFEWKDAA